MMSKSNLRVLRWLGALAIEMEAILAGKIYFSSLKGIEPSVSDYLAGVLGVVLIVAFVITYAAKRLKKRTYWDDYLDPKYKRESLITAFLRFCFFVFAYVAVLTFFGGFCPFSAECVSAPESYGYFPVFIISAMALLACMWWTYKMWEAETADEKFGSIELE